MNKVSFTSLGFSVLGENAWGWELNCFHTGAAQHWSYMACPIMSLILGHNVFCSAIPICCAIHCHCRYSSIAWRDLINISLLCSSVLTTSHFPFDSDTDHMLLLPPSWETSKSVFIMLKATEHANLTLTWLPENQHLHLIKQLPASRFPPRTLMGQGCDKCTQWDIKNISSVLTNSLVCFNGLVPCRVSITNLSFQEWISQLFEMGSSWKRCQGESQFSLKPSSPYPTKTLINFALNPIFWIWPLNKFDPSSHFFEL